MFDLLHPCTHYSYALPGCYTDWKLIRHHLAGVGDAAAGGCDFEISKPRISFHEHNEEKAGQKIVRLLAEGQSVAVVSNAGTPGISDPGYSIVRKAIEAGLPVTMIPGATAVTMALVLSGLPAHAFTFRGFPPRKSGKRRRFLAIDAESPHTLIFYESPYRLRAFL